MWNDGKILFVAVAVLLTTGYAIESQPLYQQYLSPYISADDYNDIQQIVNILTQDHLSQPIMVFYGEYATLYSPIIRSYVGKSVGQTYAYYGKLQFLMYMVDPAPVNPAIGLYSISAPHAEQFFEELSKGIGTDRCNVFSHPIVLDAPRFYNRILSEQFIQQFRVSNTLYIIPPHSIDCNSLSTWTLASSSDFASISGPWWTTNFTWAKFPASLDTNFPAGKNFNATYKVFLDGSKNYTLSVHLMDYNPSNYSPLGIWLDGTLLSTYVYQNTGHPKVLNVTMPSVGGGLHQITIGNSDHTAPFILSVDYLNVMPQP